MKEKFSRDILRCGHTSVPLPIKHQDYAVRGGADRILIIWSEHPTMGRYKPKNGLTLPLMHDSHTLDSRGPKLWSATFTHLLSFLAVRLAIVRLSHRRTSKTFDWHLDELQSIRHETHCTSPMCTGVFTELVISRLL